MNGEGFGVFYFLDLDFHTQPPSSQRLHAYSLTSVCTTYRSLPGSFFSPDGSFGVAVSFSFPISLVVVVVVVAVAVLAWPLFPRCPETVTRRRRHCEW